jgi:hypothetical protein
MVSENPTLTVVTTNTAAPGPEDPFARFRPPEPGAPTAPATAPHVAATPDQLRAMTLPQLQQELLALLAAAEGRTDAELAAEPLHADGTMLIDSQRAVFALSRIGDIVGRRKLVNLAKVDTDDLHSIAGVARLVRGALGPITPAPSSGGDA